MPKQVVFRGRFKVQNNLLFYYPAKLERTFPHKTTLQGKFRLGRRHNLIFVVDESQTKTFGRTIRFRTRVEKASQGHIEFSLLKRTTPTLKDVKRIKLNGSWRLTPHNKLTFLVKRDPSGEELKFSNAWKLDRDNQIVYSWSRRLGKRRAVNSFTLRGRWRLLGNQLSYRWSQTGSALFSQRLRLERQLIDPRQGRLAFKLGLDWEDKTTSRSKAKTISLWGRWRIKKTGFEFAVCSGPSLRFKLNKRLSNDRECTLKLVSEKGRPLAGEIVFSKKILGQSAFWLKAKFGREKRAEAGFHIPF